MPREDILHNYDDTIYFCYLRESKTFDRFISNHILVYVYSGELILQRNSKKEVIKKGEALFIKKNHLLQKIKQPSKNGEAFKAIFIELKTQFLKQVLKENPQLNNNSIKLQKQKNSNYIYLGSHPFLNGLFLSIEQYFETKTYPSKELINNKLKEAVFVLLQTKDFLAKILFDFFDPWKINLSEFMEENYTSNLSLLEFAHFSGRSLSSFKREFQRIYCTTPGKWIIKKRLKLAHSKILNSNKHITDICYEVGFKNLSHFSKAFKSEFGVSPTEIQKTPMNF